jgi:D-glycero-D-manno-heptose 1,7-bisphosphate phosphatase
MGAAPVTAHPSEISGRLAKSPVTCILPVRSEGGIRTTMPVSTRRGLILDRDGVVNVDTGYLHRIEDCRFVDGLFDMLRAFAAEGFAISIATNQSGIGRGYYGEADFQALMTWMRGVFAAEGIDLEAVYHCPDHPTEGKGVHRRENAWRKPGPGMFLHAIAELGLDPTASWTIGDKPGDLEAARAAGIGTLVLFEPASRGLRRNGDHWIAGSHRDIAGLLASGQAGVTAMP